MSNTVEKLVFAFPSRKNIFFRVCDMHLLQIKTRKKKRRKTKRNFKIFFFYDLSDIYRFFHCEN